MGPPPATAAVRSAVRRSLGFADDGDVVLVGCSGGADSLALAAAAAFVGPRAGVGVAGVTVDHGLQRGSADRAGATVDVLRRLGISPAVAVRVIVGTAGGPEAAAREARYDALRGVAEEIGAVGVLLGHTSDDQAETVLLGLARGSGARSLSGMAPVRGLWRRPLLDLPRAVVRRACAEAGLTPWEDPHNDDPAFARARVRRASGAAGVTSPARKRPVCEPGVPATCSGVPAATTLPPSSPPSGPMSTRRSAVLITSRLCSMTTTVLPASTSRCRTSSSRWTSAKCSPVVGSSRM